MMEAVLLLIESGLLFVLNLNGDVWHVAMKAE